VRQPTGDDPAQGLMRTDTLHDHSTIVEVEIPTILPMELYERVQRRLSESNPKVTAPRIVNGPTLLAGRSGQHWRGNHARPIGGVFAVDATQARHGGCQSPQGLPAVGNRSN
jgi:hypothetical protein